MRILIAKLGATGDVVRTTPLLRSFANYEITWLTSGKNTVLLDGICDNLRFVSWEQREILAGGEYDLIINLEDTVDVAEFLQRFRFQQWFGAYLGANNILVYTESSRSWFDMSLISSFGRKEADRLKFANRRTYQELIFEGLGLRFKGERYLVPEPIETRLSGDVAIAAEAGPVWPMKQWAYYDELRRQLEDQGLKVNFLPRRSSLLEHLGDVRNHRCLVGGDSLPMHLALGTGMNCVTLFTCTSPWEIYDYGILNKIVSPLLGEFFYKRQYDQRATTAITLPEVFQAVINSLARSPAVRKHEPAISGGTRLQTNGLVSG
jgi:ADP-heptose:LPS heptosyltransferase